MQPKDWSIKMNKKERRLAIATALQSAAQSITVVDDIKVNSVAFMPLRMENWLCRPAKERF